MFCSLIVPSQDRSLISFYAQNNFVILVFYPKVLAEDLEEYNLMPPQKPSKRSWKIIETTSSSAGSQKCFTLIYNNKNLDEYY